MKAVTNHTVTKRRAPRDSALIGTVRYAAPALRVSAGSRKRPVEGVVMAEEADEHAEQLLAALSALDIAWQPDTVADDEVRAVMLATALLGAAEAHLVGAEIDAYEAGADVEALRAAYGPVREEVVATAMPPGPEADPQRLLLTVRAAMLLDDLTRAAGPDEQHPDSESLAAARDAQATVSALLAYHYGPDLGPGQPARRESLSLAAALLRQLAQRLAYLAANQAGTG
jgi:hypothetical protein